MKEREGGKNVFGYSNHILAMYMYRHVANALLTVGENHLTDDYIVTEKTMNLLRQHLQETGGKVYTCTCTCVYI